ncbi:YXWGXW repeat-containing protein [Limobrevibacterium gyesilva]|uniref:YXWGXW repeat-containing protein n=1 Tax=Limobrevibacterium gyesilva TaxID=2991712 RepID=A0AA41YJL8_9PROT|nr:YXWGXW repeat-containing protein [Limobrevibacterium gyesilva]MCW3473790.1 YXWGXW repeat-containing protein [Limobrevibacterium gyesilva]
MRLRRPLSLLAATLVIGVGLAGCSTVKENAGPCPTPPPIKREEIPKPPVSEQEQIWQPGHWDWNGNNYAWREGSWIKREGRANQWMDGYWDRPSVPGTCVWNPAHWM